MKRINSTSVAAPLALTLVLISSACFAGDYDRNSATNGYNTGTPLGAATADPYGQNHFYVPGFALSPGLRAYQYGTGQPNYGQTYAPSERLRRTMPEAGPLHPYGSGDTDENASGNPYR